MLVVVDADDEEMREFRIASIKSRSRAVIPLSSDAKLAIRLRNSDSVRGVAEKRACSYCARNTGARSGGLITLNDERCAR